MLNFPGAYMKILGEREERGKINGRAKPL